MKLSSKKNSARSPKIAKILEEYNINGSFDMAKIAGIESTAKSKSVNSITATTTNNGVATFLPFSIVKNLSPSYVSLTLNNFRINLAPRVLL